MSNIPPADRTWARAQLVCCLRMPNGGVSPDTTPRCWYFELPRAHDAPGHWQELVARIMFDINTALRRRQPDDLAWIDVESIRAYPVQPRQVLIAPASDPRSLPWVNIDRQKVWEPAVCYYVDDAGRYDVMSGHDFSELLIYRLLGLGQISSEQCRSFLGRYYAEAGPSAGQKFFDDREARLKNLTTIRENSYVSRKRPYEQPYSCCPDASPTWGDFVTVGVPAEVRVAGYAEQDSAAASAAEGETASVYLEAIGESLIQVVVTVRDFLGLGLAEAKRLTESAPVVVLSDAPRAEAERFRSELERVGATVSVR